MAVTWAVSNLTRSLDAGNYRCHRGTLTATGTYTAGGDTVAASIFGLTVITQLNLTEMNDGAGNPVSLEVIPVRVSDSSWKIAIAGNVVGAVNTATVAASKTVAMGAAETLTGFRCNFEAIGR